MKLIYKLAISSLSNWLRISQQIDSHVVNRFSKFMIISLRDIVQCDQMMLKINFNLTVPTHCTHWSLTGNTAPPHWVVTHGSGWLAHRPPCSPTATGKDLIPLVDLIPLHPKQGSELMPINSTTVILVTPESGLALEGGTMTQTPVATRRRARQIMETSTSKPWGTSWYSDKAIVNFPNFKPRSHHELEKIVVC